jgi:hypothetical protein
MDVPAGRYSKSEAVESKKSGRYASTPAGATPLETSL